MNQYPNIRAIRPSDLKPQIISRQLIIGIVIHAVILLTALGLGYNSYREYMRDIEPLTRGVRDSIKATFPWAVLIFLGLYFIFKRKNKTSGIFLSWQYAPILFLYALLMNIFFLSKGKDILLPLNFSVLYSTLIIVSVLGLKRRIHISGIEYTSIAQDYLPPIVCRFITRYLPKTQTYVKEKPSALFIVGFIALLIICAFLLIFQHEKSAERVANIAYFLLVIGVGIEIYRVIKHGGKGEEED